jgi:hypothetical protein
LVRKSKGIFETFDELRPMRVFTWGAKGEMMLKLPHSSGIVGRTGVESLASCLVSVEKEDSIAE